MRSVSYVQRVALEFSGSLFPHAICLGDVDNDTVGACALETQSSAHAGRGQGRGLRAAWEWTACPAGRAVRPACVPTGARRNGLGGAMWAAMVHCVLAALVRSPGPVSF